MRFLASWRSLVDILFTPKFDSLTGWSQHLLFLCDLRAESSDEVRQVPSLSWGKSRPRLPLPSPHISLGIPIYSSTFPLQEVPSYTAVVEERQEIKEELWLFDWLSDGKSKAIKVQLQNPSAWSRYCYNPSKWIWRRYSPLSSFPTGTHTSIFYSSQFLRSHYRDLATSLTFLCRITIPSGRSSCKVKVLYPLFVLSRLLTRASLLLEITCICLFPPLDSRLWEQRIYLHNSPMHPAVPSRVHAHL